MDAAWTGDVVPRARAASSPFVLPQRPTPPDLLAKYFRTLADPTRLRIVELLADHGEMPVGALVEALGESQPKVSNHLACLGWCGFVTTRRRHPSVLYRIADDRVLALVGLATALLEDNAEHVAACKHVDGADLAERRDLAVIGSGGGAFAAAIAARSRDRARPPDRPARSGAPARAAVRTERRSVPSTAQSRPLTRLEIAAAVEAAFGPRPTSHRTLCRAARRTGARAEVIEALEVLPRRKFTDIRELWELLPEMPVR